MSELLAWLETADDAMREASAFALSAQWCAAPDADLRHGIERGLLRLACDPSLRVRLALAMALTQAPAAPHSCLVALLEAPAQVCALVLSGPHSFSDASLVQVLRQGETVTQMAIAQRARLSPTVLDMLARHGEIEVLLTLLAAHCDALPEAIFAILFQRFGPEARLRHALLARDDCPASLRCELTAAVARALTDFVSGCGWMTPERAERVAQGAMSKAALSLARSAAETGGGADARFLAHLRRSRRLTPALMLRALLSGDRDVLVRALAELSGLPGGVVAGTVAQWRGLSFEAVFRRAGLPVNLLPIVRNALRAQDETAATPGAGGLCEQLVRRVVELSPPGDVEITGLLQSLLAEATASIVQASPRIPRKHLRKPVAIDLDALEAELCAA